MFKLRKTDYYKIFTLIIILTAGLLIWHVNSLFNSAPWGSPTSLAFSIDKSSTYKTLAAGLKDKNIIQNEWVFLRQASSYDFPALGKYKLELPASGVTILDQMKKQSDQIIEDSKIPTYKLLIKEGATIDDIIANIEKSGRATKAELEAYFLDKGNFKYDYMPQPLTCVYGDVNKCAKYYAEGYIYPATYDLNKKESWQLNIDQIMRQSQAKWLLSLGGKPTYEQVILASVIERESGYGSRDKSSSAVKQLLDEERRLIASAFINRNKTGMKWQSNPTTHYGTEYKLCETTINIPNCKKLDDVEIKNNIYNTYVNTKPIGPIANPSIDSLKAAMNPATSEYLFFIADKEGATRFARNYDEFSNIEQNIINGR
jgi:UPF0755 protein